MSKNSILISDLDTSKMPKHVAIIMDGNGRWAKAKGMGRIFGHKNALKAVRAALDTCGEMKIKYLTLYAFSTENWNRPKDEVTLLFSLLVDTLKKELNRMMEESIKLQTLGDISVFPIEVVCELEKVIKATENNTNGILNLALNYGGKSEILSAVKSLAEKVKKGVIRSEDIDEKLFEENLYTKNSPNVDLMIRTSGEYRISNFLLWQIAYAELYFCDVLWPDFRKEHFYHALKNYQKRERRFGKTSEQIII